MPKDFKILEHNGVGCVIEFMDTMCITNVTSCFAGMGLSCSGIAPYDSATTMGQNAARVSLDGGSLHQVLLE
jgi:hypothetical protein